MDEYKTWVTEQKSKDVWVKRNNHFDLSERFIRKVFREFTVTPPKRSNGVWRLIYDGIGPFGYNYRLPELEVAIDPSKRRRGIRFKAERRAHSEVKQ